MKYYLFLLTCSLLAGTSLLASANSFKAQYSDYLASSACAMQLVGQGTERSDITTTGAQCAIKSTK